MNEIKVSVIVPIFNVEKFLRECLSSIQQQSLNDIEIICVNDGSTDKSLEIIEQFVESDSRFKLINKKNSGYGHSVNLGIQEAKGTYVGIVESDDFVVKDMFLKLYNAASKNEVDVAKANFTLYWSTPRKTMPGAMIKPEHSGRIIYPLQDRFVFDYRPTIWSAIYKKEFLIQSSIKFLETPGASFQDLGFNFKVWASAKTAVLLEEELIYYRQDNEASSINNKAKVFCVCDEYHEIEKFVSKNCHLPQDFKPLVARLKFHSYAWNLNRIAKPYKWDFVKKMSQEYFHILKFKIYDTKNFPPRYLARLYLIAYFPRLFLFLKTTGRIARRANG